MYKGFCALGCLRRACEVAGVRGIAGNGGVMVVLHVVRCLYLAEGSLLAWCGTGEGLVCGETKSNGLG